MKNLRAFMLQLCSAFRMYNGRRDFENEDNIFLAGYGFLLNTNHCIESIERYIAAFKKGEHQEPLGFDLQLKKCQKRLLNCSRILNDLEVLGDKHLDRYGYKFNDKLIATAKEMGQLLEANVNKIMELLDRLYNKVVLEADDKFFESYYLMYKRKADKCCLKTEFDFCKMNFGEITLDALKEQQAFVVANALKDGVLKYAKSPSKREINQVKLDSLKELLPYDYKYPRDFDKTYAKFKHFVTLDEDMLKLNYGRYGKYIFCNKHKLDEYDVMPFAEMDVLLEMINKEIQKLMNRNTPEIPISDGVADKYWQRLIESGFVDHNHQLLPDTSRKQATYIAEIFAEKLGLKSKWKYFEQLWQISNLAQEKWDMIQTGTMPPRHKEIDSIFAD